jgi:hypothetical protein
MAILTFDIEISNEFELLPGEDLEDYGPFDISVAATHVVGGEERLWMTRTATGTPAPHMSRDDARSLLGYLSAMQDAGHHLVAWNGLSFDLRWIGHVAGDMGTARKIARRLFDPMYQFFKLKGFPVGLAKVAEGMGIPAKKLMNGADAPGHWRAGNYQLVCDYVIGDVRLTASVTDAILRAKRIAWITMRGTRSQVEVSQLLPVESCMRLPMPDQSWMDDPLEDSKFLHWL